MHLISLIQQKIELFRLEQRYTRRRNRRSTFVSEAQYVDGEYIYSPTSSYVAKCSAGHTSDSDEQMDSQVQSPTTSTSSSGSKDSSVGRTGRASKRMSMMGLDKMDWRKGKGNPDKEKERRTVVVSEREVRWDDSVRR